MVSKFGQYGHIWNKLNQYQSQLAINLFIQLLNKKKHAKDVVFLSEELIKVLRDKYTN